MGVDINIWAVILAAASSMVVGSIWYAQKVFGAEWMKMVGLDPKKAEKGAAVALSLTALISLVTAYVLAHVIGLAQAYFGGSYLWNALQTGWWLWLGLTAGRMLTHDLFEGRRKKLSAINLGNEFVTIMLMALIIGLLP